MHLSETVTQSFCKYFHGLNEADKNVGIGAEGPAVHNITRTLHALGLPVRWNDQFDSQVCDSVKEFQKRVRHQNDDGVVGPGTRTKLVLAVLDPSQLKQLSAPFEPLDASFFGKLKPTWDKGFYAAFLSYASIDGTMVDDIQACLEHNGVRVIRDVSDFLKSAELKEEIRRNIESADKFLTVVTDASLERGWVTYEAQVAEMIKEWKPAPFNVYLKLTAKDMPEYLKSRLYVDGRGKTLHEIGVELVRAICLRKPPGDGLLCDSKRVLVP